MKDKHINMQTIHDFAIKDDNPESALKFYLFLHKQYIEIGDCYEVLGIDNGDTTYYIAGQTYLNYQKFVTMNNK